MKSSKFYRRKKPKVETESWGIRIARKLIASGADADVIELLTDGELTWKDVQDLRKTVKTTHVDNKGRLHFGSEPSETPTP